MDVERRNWMLMCIASGWWAALHFVYTRCICRRSIEGIISCRNSYILSRYMTDLSGLINQTFTYSFSLYSHVIPCLSHVKFHVYEHTSYGFTITLRGRIANFLLACLVMSTCEVSDFGVKGFCCTSEKLVSG